MPRTGLTTTAGNGFFPIEPPLPGVFSGRLLAGEGLPVFEDNSEVSRWLMDRSLEDLGGVPISGPSEHGDAIISDMMAAETIYALEREGGRDSSQWYTRSIHRMVAIASVLHPEIGDDRAAAEHPSGLFRNREEARTVLFAAMAITSQNITVQDNMRYALEQYRAFLEDGAFKPRSYGANGGAIENNLARFNFILERAGGDLRRVRRLLSMKMKMKELQAAAKRYGIEVPAKEMADETVYGSMLFGPKVGNGFFQNLIGNHDPVTIDLWFMRLWGRYTGTLVRDEVREEALDRLVKGLRRSMSGKRMRAMMEREGVAVEPSSVREMDAQQLLDYTRRLRLFWEKLRRKYVTGAISPAFHEKAGKAKGEPRPNSEVSELKAKLLWPGAAESIAGSLGYPVDSPRSAGLRRWIRSVCRQALAKLESHGYPMTAADMQAVLWYPEKEIYARLSGRRAERLNMSYDEAMARIALQEGASQEAVREAVDSVPKSSISKRRSPRQEEAPPAPGMAAVA